MSLLMHCFVLTVMEKQLNDVMPLRFQGMSAVISEDQPGSSANHAD